MASFVVVRLVCFAIVCLALGATIPKAQAAVTCGQVMNNLAPCASYIMSGGSTVPAQCCNGIRTLNSMAQTTPDRQAVCSCIKSAVGSIGLSYGLNDRLNLAAGLPEKCGVNIPYQISPNTDCSRYTYT